MVNVANLVCMDIYEASRPDATRTSAGRNDARATNRKGVLPWQVKDNAEAAAACKAAGKRLCTAGEWQKACQGPKGTVYVYGDTYEPKTCNGIDTFPNWDFHLAPTGDFPECTNVYGVLDISGNLWEHIKDGSKKLVRGGAYNCSDSSALHKCAYVPRNWEPSALGFRCCGDGVPVGVDAGPLMDLPPIPDTGPGDTGPETGPAPEAGPAMDLQPDRVFTH
jgi:formylglycine-generating enzyme required for sulfatase activity